MLITQRWLSDSLVGEGQDGAGCTQAQGHCVPPLCSPTLGLPAHASPAETNLCICHCHPCPRPSACHYHQPSCLLLLLFLIRIHVSNLSFHFSRSTSSISNNGGNFRQSHSRQFICVELVSRRRRASWKSGYQTFPVLYERVALSVCGDECSSVSLYACDRDKWCAWPCSWDDVSCLPSRVLNSHIVSAWDCCVRMMFALSACISRFSDMREMLQPWCFLHSSEEDQIILDSNPQCAKLSNIFSLFLSLFHITFYMKCSTFFV